jgi:hypothetical protein
VINILLNTTSVTLTGGIKICLCPCLLSRFYNRSFNDGLIQYAVEMEDDARKKEREYRSFGCFAEAVSMKNLAQICRQARYDCQTRFDGSLSASIEGLATASYRIAACTVARLDTLPSPEAIASQLAFTQKSFRQNLGWIPEEIVIRSNHENSAVLHEAARSWGFISIENDDRPAVEGIEHIKRILGKLDSDHFRGYYPYPLPFRFEESEPSSPFAGSPLYNVSLDKHTNHISVIANDYSANLPSDIARMVKEESYGHKMISNGALPQIFADDGNGNSSAWEPHWTSRRIAELDLQFKRLLLDHAGAIPDEIVEYCAGELFFLETVDWNLLNSQSKETIAFSKEFFERFSILDFIIQLVKQTPSAVSFFNNKLYAGNRQEYFLDMVNARPWQPSERLAL